MTKLEHFLAYRSEMTKEEQEEFFYNIPLEEMIEEWRKLEDDEALHLFADLPYDLKIDLLLELPYQDQETILSNISQQNKKQLFHLMEPDDIVDIIQTVSKEVRDSVWVNLSNEAKREMIFLLRFDEDDAAGLMTPRYLAVQGDITVGQAVQFIRANADKVEYVFNIYVIDKLKRFLGTIPMKDLLSASDDTIINSILESKSVFVYDDTDQEDVARTIETNDLAAVPVVDHDHILIGIVTFDDVIDVIREEQTEDVYKMGAMSGTSTSYMDTNILGLVKKRVPWLIVLLFFGTISANVLHHYESMMIGAAFLIIFMPVITQTGGNAGSQSSTLMIRGLATGDIQFKSIGRIFSRECVVGLIMGILTGLVIIFRSILLPPGVGIHEGVVIGISLMLVVIISNLIGILAPLIINKMGFDPTVMSTPLMATVIDICGYGIYFETARLLLNL
ncbi:MAG: magnesium transporter [Spirochaetia bacterium]|nr:magnesium transporter [Spirochaetia bacterium]